VKFAHITDVHLGAFGEKELRDAALETFSSAVNTCINRKVDFILISGDLFHNPVTDMHTAKEAAGILRKVTKAGIKVFMVYGSHDYSTQASSMIDILEKAELLTKVQKFKGRKLAPLVDKDLKVSIYGIDGRKNGLDQEIWKSIEGVEEPENGTVAIMMMHAAVRELLPADILGIEALSLSELPKGMNYYALGHVHYPATANINGAPVVQPGALFGSDYRDLENTAKGVRRGFYIVDDKMEPEFVEVSVSPVILKRVKMDGKQASSGYDEAMKAVEGVGRGSIVLIHFEGKLSGGKSSELQLYKIRREIIEKGARAVITNESKLEYPEAASAKFSGTVEEIERKAFEKSIAEAKVKALDVDRAIELMNALSPQKEEGERDRDYEDRIVSRALHILGVDEE